MKIRSGETLLFIGDSITDCGRARPVGEGAGLGGGYVMLVNSLLGAHDPGRRIRVLNTGISGNRVTDLEARWDSDVLALKPDWLAVMIGINDVWRQFDNPLHPAQVSLRQYTEVFRRLLARTRPALKGLVLMTPYYLEPDRREPMRRRMDEYGAAVRALAGKHGAILADVQKGFDDYLKHNPTQQLCGDRVHPNITGHMVIARTFLKAIGFRWQ